MANKVRARAELRHLSYNASPQERDQAFRILFTQFKRRCKESGIMAEYKKHEFFESKPVKDRKKRKEAELRRLKEENISVHSAKDKNRKADQKNTKASKGI